MEPLLALLRRVKRRLTVNLWTGLTVSALIWAASLSTAWLLLTRMFPILPPPDNVFPVCVSAALLASSCLTYRRRPSLLDAALEADERLGLEERFTSSLQLVSWKGPLAEALHRDALRHIGGVQPTRDFPLTLPRRARWLATTLTMYCVGYFFCPELDLLGYRERLEAERQKAETLRVRAEQIKNAVKPLKEQEIAQATDANGLASRVERIAESLAIAQISEKRALAKLTNLANELDERRAKFLEDNPAPRLGGGAEKLDRMQKTAEDLRNGEFGQAAEKVNKLQDELRDKTERGGLSEEERARLANELKELAKRAGGDDSMLGQALQKAADGMTSNEMTAAMQALRQAAQTLSDMGSLQTQYDQMTLAADCLSKSCKACAGQGMGEGWGMGSGMGQGGMGSGRGLGTGWGTSPLRSRWASGQSGGRGPGMGGPGQGAGGRIGDLPDVEAGFDPTLLPGEMTKGKVLASIMRRAAPDGDAETTLEQVGDAFIEIQNQAEQALTKEEIPPGAKEFVRQYFGSLEPESRPASGTGGDGVE